MSNIRQGKGHKRVTYCSAITSADITSALVGSLERATQTEVSASGSRILSASLQRYLQQNPGAVAAVEALSKAGLVDVTSISHDHFAYRTLGLPGWGISGVGRVLSGLGYTLQDASMTFPGKKLTAAWFAHSSSTCSTTTTIATTTNSTHATISTPLTPKSDSSSRSNGTGSSDDISTSSSSSSSGDPITSIGRGVEVHHAEGANHHTSSSGESVSQMHDPPAWPRMFVSQIEVHQLSIQAQTIIRKYTFAQRQPIVIEPEKMLDALEYGTLPWIPLSDEDYQTLASESEYAAWVLTHGYALNHTALATHWMNTPGQERPGVPIQKVVDALTSAEINMNTDGGVLKVSPDGLLIQCSTLAGKASGSERSGCYIEFVERLPLTRREEEDDKWVPEHLRRDGFEVGNADRIFTSTTTPTA